MFIQLPSICCRAQSLSGYSTARRSILVPKHHTLLLSLLIDPSPVEKYVSDVTFKLAHPHIHRHFVCRSASPKDYVTKPTHLNIARLNPNTILPSPFTNSIPMSPPSPSPSLPPHLGPAESWSCPYGSAIQDMAVWRECVGEENLTREATVEAALRRRKESPLPVPGSVSSCRM